MKDPETFLLNNLVNAYSKLGDLRYARYVFDIIPHPNLFSWNTILFTYSKSGNVSEMKDIFNRKPERDGVSWNSLISGYASRGLVTDALKGYSSMLRDGAANLNRITFSTMLILSSSQECFDLGWQIHGQIVKFGFGSYVFVSCPLMDMFSKAARVFDAKLVFDETPERNVVMYNTMITGLLRYVMVEDSWWLFRSMLEKDSISWTTMITGLTQNGLYREAIDLFREMRIEGLSMDRLPLENGYSEEAIRNFCDMQRNGITPDYYTLGSVISSCANLASLEEGAQFHGQAIVSDLFSFTAVSNALITLYGKCGSIEDADRLFNEMTFRDELSWTALVSGYAQFGKADATIDLFQKMLAHGLKPDEVTFVGVLSACSRAGVVEKGYQYFESMVKDHGITPVIDHYSCMIDLLSRAGRLEEARCFINKMPMPPDAIGWSTLLSSCRLHGNFEIGKWAAASLQELEPHNPAGVRKESRCSWIKYKGRVHIFSADDQTSPFSDQIYAKLDELNSKMVKEGYVPDLSSVLHDVGESQKTKMFNYHSERLAIAFGLLFIHPRLPIRIVKNLRVCGDCHNVTKIISKITQREILVRDAVRFHLFKDGTCSCGDFW
ncbi:putative pentatricopeptide repeat-containing protein [Hibiscus syriacus]|uniref:Pentatricopeptide repeat-containing protein n=1 Tax=Hibiscus syriacus TaxID=106335 RepID=A0A6A2ZHT8_HIBSY|nr:putative pentatricopeptide repeat-containing protein [Hibiscus syriacus]